MVLCLAGLGILSYIQYYAHISNEFVKDGDVISPIKSSSSTTYYVLSKDDASTAFFPSIPAGIVVTDHITNLVNSSNLIFEIVWSPLLIMGSYILIHANFVITEAKK
jgi:hypothetical protein